MMNTLGIFLLALSGALFGAYTATPKSGRKYIRYVPVCAGALFLWTSFWMFVWPVI